MLGGGRHHLPPGGYGLVRTCSVFDSQVHRQYAAGRTLSGQKIPDRLGGRGVILVSHQHRLRTGEVLVADAVGAAVVDHYHPLRNQSLNQQVKAFRHPGALPGAVVGGAVLQHDRTAAGGSHQTIHGFGCQGPFVGKCPQGGSSWSVCSR